MKFLLVAKQQRHVVAYIEALRILINRGHRVTVAVQDADDAADDRLAARIDAAGFRVRECPSARIDDSAAVALTVRRLRDAVHYLNPAFANAPAMQIRFVQKLREELALDVDMPGLVAALREVPPPSFVRLEDVLRLAEAGMPTSGVFDEFVRSEEPDVVLVCPLVHFGPAQADIVASARRLGIPVWMLLFSWDTLSTKGCMHVEPDLMFVWNEQQRAEAAALHGFPASRVVVVGAPQFDTFFTLRPAMTRPQFHEPLGLDPEAPTVLYLGSSPVVGLATPGELSFVVRWIAALRGSSSADARRANIVVRPHPAAALLPDGMRLEPHAWPAAPHLLSFVARPFGDSRAIVLQTPHEDPRGLYESLAQSSAVVAQNTTAELEAGIVGRPVFTIRPDIADGVSRQSTLHFHYLTREHGGFVSAAGSLDEHVQQIGDALATGVDPAPMRAFIEAFLRPQGIDRPVQPLLADALEAHAAALPPAAMRPTAPVTSDLAPSGRTEDVVRLSYRPARLVVHATPEATRELGDDGTIRLDRATVKWLERFVHAGDVVYDANAGIGAYVLLAVRQRGAVVAAFEPRHRLYTALCENMILNACQESVIPVPLALASQDGATTRAPAERSWRAQCVTRLDTAVACYRLPPANHLRLSARLPVFDVLDGAARTLAAPTLRTVWLQIAIDCEPLVTGRLSAVGLEPASRRLRRKTVQMLFQRPASA